MASPTAKTAITAPAASPAEALEPCERAILSVLRLWPRGAAEAAVAHRAGLDTTTAAAALRRLLDAGFRAPPTDPDPVFNRHLARAAGHLGWQSVPRRARSPRPQGRSERAGSVSRA